MQDQIHLYLYSCIAFESQSFKRVFYLKQIFVITGTPLERRARGNCPRFPPFNPALDPTEQEFIGYHSRLLLRNVAILADLLLNVAGYSYC